MRPGRKGLAERGLVWVKEGRGENEVSKKVQKKKKKNLPPRRCDNSCYKNTALTRCNDTALRRTRCNCNRAAPPCVCGWANGTRPFAGAALGTFFHHSPNLLLSPVHLSTSPLKPPTALYPRTQCLLNKNRSPPYPPRNPSSTTRCVK